MNTEGAAELAVLLLAYVALLCIIFTALAVVLT